MTGDERLDERLLAELGEAVRAARDVPARFGQVGRSAFTWLDVDAELAELGYDSADDPAGSLAATRADPRAVRALTFRTGGLTIEVEATANALQGQVVPPRSGEIELLLRDGPAGAVPVDDVGWFMFAVRPAGLFQLHLRTADGGRVRTAWTKL